MALKYIRYKNAGIILFEPTLAHKNVHQMIESPFDPVISAGKVSIWAVNDSLEVNASGGSTSLEVNSRDDDADLIKRRLKLY